jgi:hypothetical protein
VAILAATGFWIGAVASLVWIALLRPWVTAAALTAASAATTVIAWMAAPGYGRMLAFLYLAPLLTTLFANIGTYLATRSRKPPAPRFSRGTFLSYIFELERLRLREEFEQQRSTE